MKWLLLSVWLGYFMWTMTKAIHVLCHFKSAWTQVAVTIFAISSLAFLLCSWRTTYIFKKWLDKQITIMFDDKHSR